MSQIKIKSYTLGMVSTNTYIAVNETTNEALIIDPADRADYLSRELTFMGVKPVAILLTHGHFDHIMAVNELKAKYDIPVYAHEDEKDVLCQTSLNMSTMIGARYTTKADVYLKDDQEMTLAGFFIVVLHTPGHTKGGCCYYLPEEEVLFSGVTLFHGSIGRTDFPTGSYKVLAASIRERIYTLPDWVKVFPGHGPATTVEEEKHSNMFVRALDD